MAGNKQSTRNYIPDKDLMIDRIVSRRIGGDTNGVIAKDEKISHHTAEKYYREGLRRAGLLEDVELVLKREIMRVDRAYDKCTRDYLASKCKASEFVSMANIYWKLNGIERNLDTIVKEVLPPAVQVEVKQVPFELPPLVAAVN